MSDNKQPVNYAAAHLPSAQAHLPFYPGENKPIFAVVAAMGITHPCPTFRVTVGYHSGLRGSA